VRPSCHNRGLSACNYFGGRPSDQGFSVTEGTSTPAISQRNKPSIYTKPHHVREP
jgi:hypothetical protein